MSFTQILHQGIHKYDKPNTIKTSEICNKFVECPECEMILEAHGPGQDRCSFCNKSFIAV